MKNYLELLKKVLEEGEDTKDRTGVGTRRIFAPQLRFKFEGNKIPIITTKRVFMKGVIIELLWFLQGSTNIKFLLENNVHIWDEWADDMGELGPVYGKQWRAWETKEGNKIDQISNVVNTLRNNPTSRRNILNAWNVGEIDKMHLPPCHMMCQFFVNNEGGIITHLYQRSADLFLGVPFNISSYAILTRLLAMHSGLKASELIMTFGDAHIYNNHMEQVKLQLSREPYEQTTELFIEERPNIFSHVYEDFRLEGYKYHPNYKSGGSCLIVSLIAAVDSKNGIGLNGVMPWGHIKEDMQFFRSTTTGYAVVMGRVTFESLGGKPLPNRKNIVISSNKNELSDKYDNLFYESSFENAISKLLLEKHNQIFIIGGESIYKRAMDYADKIYLTHINKNYNCDRFFPEVDSKLFSSRILKNFVYDDVDVSIVEYSKIF